ncbi:dihydrofolate reductase [Paenilisteria rocourtiae]|uniref:Dihydrofolate reductase n=1 Tax=Listeria rocourtiae TaxID=647910 RepID=A0A4R6ZRH0_9LIST|nr:dihydrofolate reductase [Listeria rocourtiae]EUJ49384.1 dihydrofolate reductase [Listeria rocourtiae FSL F6-920]MBC1435846.1 dihydrofolate reductase [Listeria rocourtiae]MBC1603455.1 dihydrofolate reductase [Listeria rocourtiae]TDR55260.1 dihydrofolate reductase [Listeria rocourtiae]
MLTFIWAQDRDGYIGKDNTMPWRLPADLQHFKKETDGQTIVMGRKTYESIGKALPNRENIILTRNPNYVLPDAKVVHSKEEILELATEKSVFITGGAEIYQLFLDDADVLIVTHVEAECGGDTRFPAIDWKKWKLIKREDGVRDAKNDLDFWYGWYEKEAK